MMASEIMAELLNLIMYSLSWTQLIIDRETCCFPEKEVWNHANQRPKRHASPRDQVVVLSCQTSTFFFFSQEKFG